jgi:hypothetical protein
LQLPTRIFGYYFDIRYNGVPINRDLVLDVDGHRCLLPSGFVIADDRHTTPAPDNCCAAVQLAAVSW